VRDFPQERTGGARPIRVALDSDGDDAGLEKVAGKGTPPEFLLLAEEGCRHLLDLLDEELLRRIALWKLIGHTSEEIARKLDCSLAKVERKLERIRRKWIHLVPVGSRRSVPRNAAGVEVAEDTDGTTVILRALAGDGSQRDP
jgi:hypothetical protein